MQFRIGPDAKLTRQTLVDAIRGDAEASDVVVGAKEVLKVVLVVLNALELTVA